MRREGSALHGLGVVFYKELADQLSSVRFFVLQLMVVLTAAVALSGAIRQIAEITAEDQFLFLRLFTTAREPLWPLVIFLGLLVPLVAIGLAFDAVNGEHNRRTLSRILAQPIYRDALLFGKFLAGLATLGISLIALWLLLVGFGLFWLGVPPGIEEVARSLLFMLVAIAYAGVWLALALFLSIVFRSAATAALVALGLWLFLTIIWPILVPDLARAVLSTDDPASFISGAQMLLRLSPNVLFNEIVAALLDPSTRTLAYTAPLQGAIPGAPLPFSESLLIAWPAIAGLVAATILLFVAGYIVFQRQEVRA